MAQRRMFSLDIVDTDLFLDMPASTQNLYFHLGMRADDDGFVSSPKRITVLVNCSGDDLKLLIAKGLVMPFDTGVCVIRDWKINNYIQKDRYRETIHLTEKSKLMITANGSYSILDTECIHDVSGLDTQARLGKSSIELDKDNSGENNYADTSPAPIRINYQKPVQVEQSFLVFWDEYPRKVGKAAALKAWLKIKPSAELHSRILKALTQQKKSAQWQRDDGQYIPHPTTWLNQGRWDDEPPEAKSHSVNAKRSTLSVLADMMAEETIPTNK